MNVNVVEVPTVAAGSHLYVVSCLICEQIGRKWFVQLIISKACML